MSQLLSASPFTRLSHPHSLVSLTHLWYLHESVPEAASVPLEAERQLGEVPLQGPRKYTIERRELEI